MNRAIFSFLLSCSLWIVSLTPVSAKSNEPTKDDNCDRTNSSLISRQSVVLMKDILAMDLFTASKVQVSLDAPVTEIISSENKISQIKVEPSSGSFLGACEDDEYFIKISGATFGDGTDISSVTICGVEVCQILMQSSNLVIVFPNSGKPGTGDIVITSESLGKTTIENAFTYNVPAQNEQSKKIQVSKVDVSSGEIDLSSGNKNLKSQNL